MQHWFKILAIGMVMGAAEVVPGVSGGTIAFISGIYERLVNGIRQFNPYLLVGLKHHGIKAVWHRVDGTFLVVLFGGMGVSIILFAGVLGHLLRNEPVGIWSFFAGLVIASTFLVYQQISRFSIDVVVGIALGAAFGIVITNLVPIELEPTPLFLFVGGAIAICAWILPGLSGSFILLILGLYAVVIDAIEHLNIIVLGSLAAGCAVGIVSFAQILSRLFRRFRDETLAVLTGFMLGSLVKLWPWKHTISYQLRDDGSQIPLVQEPVMPDAYLAVTGNDADLMVAIISVVAGFLVVLLVDWLANASWRDA